MTILYIFVFVLGTIVGSFLNVVILRMNSGWGIGGRSKCFSCGRTLTFIDLIPFFSFLFLRGKCRTCKSKISIQYPLVELATGLIFVLFFCRDLPFPILDVSHLLTFLSEIVIWCVLLVIFVYDVRHQIIPNAYVYAFSILGIVYSFLQYHFFNHDISFLLHRLIAGGVLFLFFFLLWFFSKGTWVGFGDAKLSLGIGFYLGLTQSISALAYAFWIGAAVSVSILVMQKIQQNKKNGGLKTSMKTLTMKSAIPFAPFLILGTCIAMLLGSDVFGLHYFF